MLNESQNNHNKNTSTETTNFPKGNMICKDGFCALPNKKETSKQETNDMNLFDPI